MRPMDNESEPTPGSPVILIPAYNPSAELEIFVGELIKSFSRIVVVDDGSTKGLEFFDAIRDLPGVELLRHQINRGKGAALKTGFRHIGNVDTVTADADGQHAVRDVIKVARALNSHRGGLVLGVRAFKGEVPFRSRFGNFWTRLFFFLFSSVYVSDTQTGLRGIPAGLTEKISSLPGDGYEYEMAMLTNVRIHPEKPLEVPIETIYEAGNGSSHFSPLADTVKIYRAMFAELRRQRKLGKPIPPPSIPGSIRRNSD